MTATSADYMPSPEAMQAALGSLGAADLVLLATHAMRVGSLSYAVEICEAYQGPPEPALQVTLAAALFGRRQHGLAFQIIEEVLARDPSHLAALFYGAQMAQQLGDEARAAQMLLSVAERLPDFPGAHGVLAGLRFPGPLYRDILQRLHEILGPKSYLEIGVETGATLAFAKASERAIGIDPDASKLQRTNVPPCARVFHETSDDFFAQHTRESLLGEHRLDLAFIDGMHWFEYALRDFINVEAWCHPGSIVVLHDCLPVLPITASRERLTNFWVGDVWKVVSILREYRPELRVKIVATAPSGLCIVRGVNPESRVLQDKLPEIVERYMDMAYPAAAFAAPAGFELVKPNAAGLREALQ